jgi:S1-C subfamily serine protease
MDYETHLVARLKDVFSDLKEVEERLDSEPEAFLPPTFRPEEIARLEDFGAMGLPKGAREPGLSPVDQIDLGRGRGAHEMPLLATARRGLTKIRDAGDSPPDLTEGEVIALEAIILLEGRPSILIEDGRFAPPPAEWSILETHRDSIERVIPSVGRIEVTGHPRLEWVGTGFLVASDVIMTNRHVATEFSAKRRGEGWKFLSGMAPRIDFREEHESAEQAQFNCTEVIGVHPRQDMALLRVALESDSSAKIPQPLTVQYRSPQGVRKRKVYVIGYPAWDGRRNDPEAMRLIFGGIYDVKRLQPGTIRNHLVLGRTFKHDASTMGGNSGSCVVDLESGKVLGLHFAGRYRKRNTAVALWKLREGKFLQSAGVQFG